MFQVTFCMGTEQDNRIRDEHYDGFKSENVPINKA